MGRYRLVHRFLLAYAFMQKRMRCWRRVEKELEMEQYYTVIRMFYLVLESKYFTDPYRCPCLTCAIKIVQVGIQEVVYRWGYSMDEATARVMREGGVKLRQFSPVSLHMVYCPTYSYM